MDWKQIVTQIPLKIQLAFFPVTAAAEAAARGTFMRRAGAMSGEGEGEKKRKRREREEKEEREF